MTSLIGLFLIHILGKGQRLFFQFNDTTILDIVYNSYKYVNVGSNLNHLPFPENLLGGFSKLTAVVHDLFIIYKCSWFELGDTWSRVWLYRRQSLVNILNGKNPHIWGYIMYSRLLVNNIRKLSSYGITPLNKYKMKSSKSTIVHVNFN